MIKSTNVDQEHIAMCKQLLQTQSHEHTLAAYNKYSTGQYSLSL